MYNGSAKKKRGRKPKKKTGEEKEIKVKKKRGRKPKKKNEDDVVKVPKKSVGYAVAGSLVTSPWTPSRRRRERLLDTDEGLRRILGYRATHVVSEKVKF